MLIGVKKEKLINSKKILSYFRNENSRELYKTFVESAMKAKTNQDEMI